MNSPDGHVRRFVESAGSLGRLGWLLGSLAATFALISVYGWSQGLTGEAARVGFLAVTTLVLLLSVVALQGWVGPWLVSRVRERPDER
jgi:hypothetical protein